MLRAWEPQGALRLAECCMAEATAERGRRGSSVGQRVQKGSDVDSPGSDGALTGPGLRPRGESVWVATVSVVE